MIHESEGFSNEMAISALKPFISYFLLKTLTKCISGEAHLVETRIAAEAEAHLAESRKAEMVKAEQAEQAALPTVKACPLPQSLAPGVAVRPELC